MGSTYNLMMQMVEGDGAFIRGHLILPILGLSFGDVPRFRDLWVEKIAGEPVIVLMTRTGGEYLRAEYEAEISLLQEHPLYLSDADEEFDSTMMSFRFGPPEGCAEDLMTIAVDPIDIGARWAEALEMIKGMKLSE